jgi:predicted ATP-dependent serine protease
MTRWPSAVDLQTIREKQKAATGKKSFKLEDLIRNAKVLQTKTFADLKWIAPDVLPEGLTLMVGRPKIGKSWMALDVAVAVTMIGGKFLGKACEQGDVLALFLEDNDRRLQRRMTMMLGAYKETWPERLTYATEWPKLADGGIELIREWIGTVEKPRLIIIDILERVRSRGTDKQTVQYSDDYQALETLHKLATEFELSILVLHHQRKAGADDLMDTISGTGGIGGAVDAVLVLGKDFTGHFLYGRGRDLEEFNYAVKQNEQRRWDNLGDKPENQASPEREAIVAVLRKANKPMTIDEIARAIGKVKTNVRKLLTKLHYEGDIERVATGLYRWPTLQPDLDLEGGP